MRRTAPALILASAIAMAVLSAPPAAAQSVKYGYMNLAGDVMIPLQFDSAGAFRNGVAVIKLGTTYGLSDYLWDQRRRLRDGVDDDHRPAEHDVALADRGTIRGDAD